MKPGLLLNNKLQENQVSIRCDRISGDNKGGTMISVQQHMQRCNTRLFTSNGIEVIVTTLTLPNAKCLQIALLYRSPTVPTQQLIIMLSTVLNYASMSTVPTLILGDFNDNVLDQRQTESPIVTLMSTHGYTQLVNNPTTARGTLIDHIYYNQPNDNVIVEVHDTYYSDHDAVFCSILM